MTRRSLAALLVAFLAAELVRRRLDVVEVRGRSMAPALMPGDRLLVARLAPRRAGDVAMAPDPRDPGRELVKRVSRLDATTVTLRGDNAAASTDARAFGTLPRSAVRWRALGRYWPPDRIGPVPRASRIERFEEGGEPACAFPEALVADVPD